MNEAMRWTVAIPACLLVVLFGTWVGFVLTTIFVFWYFGSDVDGAMNFFFLAPFGCLLGLGAGGFLGSKFIRWARYSETNR